MANTANTTTTPTPPASGRRTLFVSADSVIIGSGITAGAAASLADLVPTEPASQTIVDAMVLLMAASAETRSDFLHEDGTFSRERGDIMVRRVMHFLAGHAGASLADYGGAYLLSSEGHEALALQGTIAEAAVRFNKVDQATAAQRHDDEQNTLQRHLILARSRLGERGQIERLVREATRKWANISDDNPRFDAGRAMLQRSDIKLPGKS